MSTKSGVKWQLETVSPSKIRLIQEIESLGADPYAARMWERGVTVPIKVRNVSCAVANIIKQEALASGIDAAVARGTVNGTIERSDLLIIGTVRGVKILSERLKVQGFGLPKLAEQLLDTISGNKTPSLHMRDRVLSLESVQVMGILNTTPDSFSDGGRYSTEQAIDARIEQIFDEGATIIDVGGVSTKPGFTAPSVEEEVNRLQYAVKRAVKVAGERGGYVSIDTYRYDVAKVFADCGVDLINDQEELASDGMAELCAKYNLGLCLMTRGNLAEVKENLSASCAKALSAGVNREYITIDPGFGFGKSLQDNYLVLHYLSELCTFNYPLLVGVSNKSMIGGATGRAVADRGAGTVAAELVAMLNGASIVRTHNVAACVDAVAIHKMLAPY